MKKKATTAPVSDPTIETTDIVINGKAYRMCFDLGALAQAEDALIAEGHDVNLLHALPRLNLSSVRVIFAASIRKFHPEITYEDALALLTMPYVYKAGVAIHEAWEKSLAEPDPEAKQNPIQPGA